MGVRTDFTRGRHQNTGSSVVYRGTWTTLANRSALAAQPPLRDGPDGAGVDHQARPRSRVRRDQDAFLVMR